MTRLLDGALPGELLLVAAPAGWGKTTAVSQWAATSDRPVAWVDCNAVLGEPDALWEVVRTSLTDALGTDGPKAPQSSLPVDRPILHHVLAPLLSTKSEVVLVLDDLQVLDDPAVLDDLKALVAHPPASLLLVLVTRADPLLALYRARAAGVLTEVRANDLAFTAEETRRLVEQRGITLPGVREINKIRDRMEGWATGLGLALSSLVNAEGSAASDLGTRAGPLLTGYLVEQVLDRLDPADRRLLIQLSVVDRFDATLAEQLTGAPVSLARLDGLAQIGGFLTSDPLESLPFRIHGLLRTVLRDELRIADGSLVRAVNVRAAEWYRSVDLIGPAIDCALEARDWDLAADLLVDLASLGIANGPLTAAARYLERFRTGRTAIDPRAVLVDVALSLDRGDVDGSAARLAMAAEAIESLPPASRVRADLLRRVLAAGIEYLRGGGQRLLTVLGPDEDFAVVGDRHAPWSSADGARRACARSLRAYGELHRGRLAVADRTANEAMGAASSDFALVEVHARQLHAAIAVARGDLRRALELSGEAKRVANRRAGALTDDALLANGVAAWSLLEQGDFDGASAEIEEVRKTGGPARQVGQVGGYLIDVIDTRLDAANGQDPTSVVSDVRNITERRPSAHYPYLFKTMRLATTVHALLAMGAHADALKVIESGPISVRDDNAALARATVIARTAIFDPAAVGDEEMARLQEAVSSLERGLHADSYSGWAVRLLLAAAVIESREDHHDRSSVLLHRALAETEQQGWRLPYLELGGVVVSLLSRERLRISAYSSLIGDLLHDLDQPMEEPRADLVVALSKREIEILRVLPAGCDQDELARQLFISKNTLKTHLRAIYRKLGVESRRQAVLRGERLHLL